LTFGLFELLLQLKDIIDDKNAISRPSRNHQQNINNFHNVTYLVTERTKYFQ